MYASNPAIGSTLLSSYSVIFHCQYFGFGSSQYSEDWAGRGTAKQLLVLGSGSV